MRLRRKGKPFTTKSRSHSSVMDPWFFKNVLFFAKNQCWQHKITTFLFKNKPYQISSYIYIFPISSVLECWIFRIYFTFNHLQKLNTKGIVTNWNHKPKKTVVYPYFKVCLNNGCVFLIRKCYSMILSLLPGSFNDSGCSCTKLLMCRTRFSSKISFTSISIPLSSTSPNSWLIAVPKNFIVGLKFI